MAMDDREHNEYTERRALRYKHTRNKTDTTTTTGTMTQTDTTGTQAATTAAQVKKAKPENYYQPK